MSYAPFRGTVARGRGGPGRGGGGPVRRGKGGRGRGRAEEGAEPRPRRGAAEMEGDRRTRKTG